MNSSIFVLLVREIGKAQTTDKIVQICLDKWDLYIINLACFMVSGNDYKNPIYPKIMMDKVMNITIYGYIFIPLFILLFVIIPKHLIYFLIITLTLQITSLFNIPGLDNYSLQIYRLLTLLLSIRLLVYLSVKGKISFIFKEKNLKNIILYGLLFSIYTIVWSFMAPFIFEGYPVYKPNLSIDFCAINGPVPLHFSFYNIALSIYVILYILTLVYILMQNWKNNELLKINRLMKLCLLIVIITSLSQILTFTAGIYDITKYLYTITTREYVYSTIGNFINLPRVQSTFLEPSMLAPFISGFYSYYLYKTLVNFNFKNFVFTIITLFILILSASSTVYISFIVITFIIIFYIKPIRIIKNDIKINKKYILLLFVGILIIFLIFFIIINLTIGLENFLNIINLYIFKKSETGSFKYRIASDLHALKLFFKTFGFGVGLGSNRPSSLLTYLLSQLGIIGTYLFFAFIKEVILFTYKNLKNSKYFSWFFTIFSILICQIIAYPDITNPTLWQFIYFLVIVSIGVKSYEYLH